VVTKGRFKKEGFQTILKGTEGGGYGLRGKVGGRGVGGGRNGGGCASNPRRKMQIESIDKKKKRPKGKMRGVGGEHLKRTGTRHKRWRQPRD